MGLLLIIMVYLLDKIIPISRTVKWVENGNVAYYEALTWIESALLTMTWSDPTTETSKNLNITAQKDYWYTILATWSIMPITWEWTSEYDSSWNRIWPWEPIQLYLLNWMDWVNAKFKFRVPKLSSDWTVYSMTWTMAWSWLISWSLSWSWETLISTWAASMIRYEEIWDSGNTSWTNILLDARNWYRLDLAEVSLSTFYNDTLDWNCLSTNRCTLKLSLINPLYLSNWSIAPYLEYQIDWWTNPKLPEQYAIIKSDWYSTWFKRSKRKEVRQMTINEALDFTVFQ